MSVIGWFFVAVVAVATVYISHRIRRRKPKLTDPEDYARRSQYPAKRAADELLSELGPRYGIEPDDKAHRIEIESRLPW